MYDLWETANMIASFTVDCLALFIPSSSLYIEWIPWSEQFLWNSLISVQNFDIINTGTIELLDLFLMSSSFWVQIMWWLSENI